VIDIKGIVKINTKNVKPFWSKSEEPTKSPILNLISLSDGHQEMPRFLKRTETKYAQMPLFKTLGDRGISNRLLDSLLEFLPDGAVIAGGFMTSVMQGDKLAKDVDIFFTSAKAFDETCQLFLNPPEDEEAWAYHDYKLDPSTDLDAFSSNNGQAFRFLKFVHPTRLPVQLVKLVWYDSPEHVIDSFDFTVAQFAASGTSLYCNPLSVFDLAKKRLVLHRIQFPASTLRRLIKYTHKGYYACPGSLEVIAEESAKAINENPEILQGYVYLD
jgi:hypothetical protein